MKYLKPAGESRQVFLFLAGYEKNGCPSPKTAV